MSQQRKEVIWIGSTDDGIYGFNMATDRFLKIPILHHCSSDWHNETFYCVLEDHAGNLWTVNDDDEVVYYNYAENKFYFLPYKRKHSSLRTFSSFLYEDKNHTIWISNVDELMTIDTDQKDIFSFQHDPTDPYSMQQIMYVVSTCQ
jgi:ligand-binding sensor domain-containing protein